MNILIVIDPQNDFITGALPGHDAVAVANSIARHITSRAYDEIICTLDTHNSNYANTQEGRNLPILHCQFGTHGWDMYAPIAHAIHESRIPVHIIEKRDSFGCEAAVEHLKAKDPSFGEVERLTLCGFVTDICVAVNALLFKAMLPEVSIQVIANLCAATTPENQTAALQVMRSCQVAII